ncbi:MULTISPECIES: PsiF family protein, partial [Pseudomonas]
GDERKAFMSTCLKK